MFLYLCTSCTTSSGLETAAGLGERAAEREMEKRKRKRERRERGSAGGAIW